MTSLAASLRYQNLLVWQTNWKLPEAWTVRPFDLNAITQTTVPRRIPTVDIYNNKESIPANVIDSQIKLHYLWLQEDDIVRTTQVRRLSWLERQACVASCRSLWVGGRRRVSRMSSVSSWEKRGRELGSQRCSLTVCVTYCEY